MYKNVALVPEKILDNSKLFKSGKDFMKYTNLLVTFLYFEKVKYIYDIWKTVCRVGPIPQKVCEYLQLAAIFPTVAAFFPRWTLVAFRSSYPRAISNAGTTTVQFNTPQRFLC